MNKRGQVNYKILFLILIVILLLAGCVLQQKSKNELPIIQVIFSEGNGWTGWEKTLTINNNGSVIFEEQQPFNGNKTIKYIQLSDEEIQEFKKLVNDANVFNFQDSYTCEPNCPTDMASSSVKFIIDGKKKLISMYVPGEMPEKFEQILEKIDLTTKTSTDSYCGNGECDDKERADGICPEDCKNDSGDIDYEDSPFGIAPAIVDGSYSYAQDIGVRWTQPGLALAWAINQPDINSNAYHFKSISQKGQLVDGDDVLVSQISNLGYAYSGFEHDTPIIENPADDRYYLTDSETFPVSWKPREPLKLSNYIKKAVERYDGDDDFGCVVPAPDCYVAGDNEYPTQETVNAFKNAPMKNWIIGNEPPVALIKGNNLDNNYDVYAKIAVESIKSVCSDCKVFNGGFTGWPTNYTAWTDAFILILAKMGNTHFDGIDMHWYGNAVGDYRFIDPLNNLDMLNHLKSKLTELGYPSNIPIWITEMSSYSGVIEGGRNQDFLTQSEQQQAGDYIKRHVYPLSRGVEKIFVMFGLIEGFSNEDGYYDHTGLIYDGRGSSDLGRGVKKLSYYSYKLMVEKLEGSDLDNIQEVYNSENVYAYKFIKKSDGSLVYVVWWDYWNEPSLTTKQVSISVSSTENAKITEAVPKYETGQEVTNYATAFNVGGVSVSNGIITLNLGQSPVYIEETSESLGNYVPHAWQAPATSGGTSKDTEKTSYCGDGYCDGAAGEKTSCPQDCVIQK